MIKQRKIKKKIESYLDQLTAELEKYRNGESLDSKYRSQSLGGKIDLLQRLQELIRIKKLKRNDVDVLKQVVEERYRKIRMIPKAERSFNQTMEGVFLEAQLDILNIWVIPELFEKQ
ncbi:MAG: hypothetical protein ACOC7U_03365 [Spirochaetota bacterium]